MPAININDLNNAKIDLDHIKDIATSQLPNATDRLGNAKRTLKGAMDDIVVNKRIDFPTAPVGPNYPGTLWYDTTTETLKIFKNSTGWTVFTPGGTTAPVVAELVTNGIFTTDTVSWTGSTATLSVVTGAMRVANTSPSGKAFQVISGLIVGQSYIATGKLRSVTGPAYAAIYADTVNASGTALANSGGRYATAFETFSMEFVAPATQVAFTLGAQAGDGLISEYDDISLKLFPVATAAPLPAGWPLIATQPGATPPELIVNPMFVNGLTNWQIGFGPSDFIVPSELRTNGSAVQSSVTTYQIPAAGVLIPGNSYTLMARVKTLVAGTGYINVTFLTGVDEPYRIYEAPILSQSYTDVTVDFTVPLYATKGVIALKPRDRGVAVQVDLMSLKQRSPIPEVEPIGSTVDSHVPVGYSLAFNDEFNGTALDRRKWHTRYMYSGTTLDRLNDEKQRYTDNNVHIVSNGTLKLMARKVNTNADGINYEAGLIRSDWCSYYGYYETRVKMPGGRGTWSAFWIDADVSAGGATSWPPEIDFFEHVVNGSTQNRNMINNNVHVRTGSKVIYSKHPNYNEQYGFYTAPFNFNEGWHTIGCEWGPDFIKNYVDGVMTVHRSANWNGGDPTKLAGPAHIILNLAIGGAWAGADGIDDLAFPQALEVDWVRAYKKNS